MNNVQRWIVIGGLIVLAAALAYPPTTLVWARRGDNLYASAGRTWLIWPTQQVQDDELKRFGIEWATDVVPMYRRFDWYRVAGECGVILALTGAAYLFAKRWDTRHSREP